MFKFQMLCDTVTRLIEARI